MKKLFKRQDQEFEDKFCSIVEIPVVVKDDLDFEGKRFVSSDGNEILRFISKIRQEILDEVKKEIGKEEDPSGCQPKESLRRKHRNQLRKELLKSLDL